MFVRTVTCYVILLATLASANMFAETPENGPTQMGETLQLYFAADRSYQPGDLITRSQLAEFQVYLRTTHGTGLATKPRWLNRTLPDNASLVTIFHRGGRAVLRPAAARLGGYAELDRIARTGAGRKVIQQAIEEKSPEPLVRWVLEKRQAATAKQPTSSDRKDRRAPAQRIYTAGDYLAAVQEGLRAQATPPGQPPSAAGE